VEAHANDVVFEVCDLKCGSVITAMDMDIYEVSVLNRYRFGASGKTPVFPRFYSTRLDSDDKPSSRGHRDNKANSGSNSHQGHMGKHHSNLYHQNSMANYRRDRLNRNQDPA